VPIIGSEKTVGVLYAAPRQSELLLDLHQRNLFNSFAHQVGMALEVDRLEHSTRKAAVEIETERMRSSLLSSVSHDFRTPLTAIVGSASALIDKEDVRKGAKGIELLKTIQSEGERLSRLVQNLLETTRLESGTVQIKKEK
jgi:two-component system sensor histidine kinase KdpD